MNMGTRLNKDPGFGDDHNTVQQASAKLFGRVIIAIPGGIVGIALCATIIGLPLGILVLGALGAWISKPLRDHPNYNTSTNGYENFSEEDLDDPWS